MAKAQNAPPQPPGTEPMHSVTCKDVVMGRGSGAQSHCGNVTYRKLVYLNKELYVTSSKFDKRKIAIAIVAAVREFGGKFVQADDKRGGLYFDIGDKRAWDKTSQSLREGQGEVSARLAKEDPSGALKIAEYRQVISEQTFFAYACMMLESLYHPSPSGWGACGSNCPHAKRRQTLHQIGADPMRVQRAMQLLAQQPQQTPPPPQMQRMQPQQQMVQQQMPQQQMLQQQMPQQQMTQQQMPQQQMPQRQMQRMPPQSQMQPMGMSYGGYVQQSMPHDGGLASRMGGAHLATGDSSANSYQFGAHSAEVDSSKGTSYCSGEDLDLITPLPYKAPALGGNGQLLEPLPFAPVPGNETQTPSAAEVARPTNAPRMDSSAILGPSANQDSFEPLPYWKSIRQFCCEDLEISSQEGNALVDQLDRGINDLISRKSAGLIKIDTTLAFEDLVYEEDSLSKEKDFGALKSCKSPENSNNDSMMNMSDPLMNMSIMSDLLDEMEKNNKVEAAKKSSDGKSSRSFDWSASASLRGGMLVKQLSCKKRDSRISLAWKNVSITSLNDQSFSQLVDSVMDKGSDDAAADGGQAEGYDVTQDEGNSTVDSMKVSRQMGFPIRPGVLKKVIPRRLTDPSLADGDQTVVDPGKVHRRQTVSSLTVTDLNDELGDAFSQRSLKKMAPKVDTPSTVPNSLRQMDTSLSNLSALGTSNMSLGFE